MRQTFTHRVAKAGPSIALGALLCAIVAVAGRATPLAQALGAVSILLLLSHAVSALGWVEALAFSVICLVVTFSLENAGVRTGFPFGHYAFLVDPNLPHVGVIPAIVGPLYAGMGYPAWIIASLLVCSGVRRPATRLEMIALPVVAAFAMVQWDAVMDPSASTLAKDWAWYGGGRYFGVPLSNFLGWFGVTYTYFQAFSWLLYQRRHRAPYPARGTRFWALPVAFYLAAGLCHIPPLFDADSVITDASGQAWSAAALRGTAVVVMFATMLPTALLALLRLAAPK